MRPLHEELEMLNLYIELENLRFKNKFDYIQNISTDFDLYTTEIPTMFIQPFIENAIHHGLFNLPDKGKLKLNISKSREGIIIIIEDNGVGRNEAKVHSENKKNHISRGMELVNERAQALSQIDNIKISIRVIDLINDMNQPAGTKVTLEIPESLPNN